MLETERPWARRSLGPQVLDGRCLTTPPDARLAALWQAGAPHCSPWLRTAGLGRRLGRRENQGAGNPLSAATAGAARLGAEQNYDGLAANGFDESYA